MKIDLCKLLQVEEGEEFEIEGFGIKYRVYNNRIQYFNKAFKKWRDSILAINELLESEMIKLPKKKKFSQDTLNFFKCIDKEYKWIAKDMDGEVNVFCEKPIKDDTFWLNKNFYIGKGINQDMFDQIYWEDEEPVCIDDYVER